MSWNMVAKVRQEGFHNSRIFQLNRANVGFTGSARIALRDGVEFGDVILEVKSIVHKHQTPHGDKAPTTVVYVESEELLSNRDIQTLLDHGFKE